MSLRTVHIVFIVAATALAGGFGAWCFRVYRDHGDGPYLAGAVVAGLGAAALVVYGVRFIRKFNHSAS